MFKKSLLVFILGVGIFALRGGDVEAHLAGYTYSPTFRHVASYDCLGHFYQIPSPKNHPATFQCIAVVKELQVTCENPQGNRVTPGVPSGPYTLIGQVAFDDNDVIAEKTKGRADKAIRFGDDGSPLLNACAERNRNWRTVDELILSVEVTLKTFDCPDESCTNLTPADQAYEAKLNCTVPEGFSLPDNPPPGNGTETDYNCTLIAEEHCDRTGACPIQ